MLNAYVVVWMWDTLTHWEEEFRLLIQELPDVLEFSDDMWSSPYSACALVCVCVCVCVCVWSVYDPCNRLIWTL